MSMNSPERIWLQPGSCLDPPECSLSHVGMERVTPEDVAYIRDDWLPIETAPKDGTSFLVGDVKKGYVNRAFYMDGYLMIVGGNHEATHWRPLPEISEDAVTNRS